MNHSIPRHVAIVMDGNGRWAESRNLPRVEGHRAGIDAVKSVVQCCLEKKISTLSLFAFSSENWQRPEKEVDFLMQLFIYALKQEVELLHEQGILLQFIGDREHLSSELQSQMLAAEDLTRENNRLTLNVAVNYSGKWDILQAVKTITDQVANGLITLDKISESTFASCLSTHGLEEPDLFIRTSGEQRISNFFLWQLAYTELYFTETHWPDFTAEAFEIALKDYSSRERRYGRISKQLDDKKHV